MKTGTVRHSHYRPASWGQIFLALVMIFSMLLSSVQSALASPADPDFTFHARAQAATGPFSIWPDPVAPTYPAYSNALPIEMGLKFQADIPGYVTGVRFFKADGATGTHIGRLWTMGGDKLAEVTFNNETASGWQSATFPNAVAIQANTTYIISYYVADGNRRFSLSQNFFTSSGVDNSPLHALAEGVEGHNGVYSDTGGFFNQANASTNYWVDLIFDSTPPPPDEISPSVSLVSPLENAVEVSISANISASFNETMQAATINGENFELRDADNNLVPAVVTYNGATYTAELDPTANLELNQTYTALVTTGVTDIAGNPLAAAKTWTFTTEAPDTTLPEVVSVKPIDGVSKLRLATKATVYFSEAMDPATINTTTVEMRDAANNLVPATVTYDSATNSLVLDPISDLGYSTTYTTTVKSGAGGVKDVYQNGLASDYSWSFSTVGERLPVDFAPGGPILILTTPDNLYSRYYAEIIRTEGFNAFALMNIGDATLQALDNYDIVILGNMPVTADQVAMLTDWVTAGGHLVAMRPDKQLAELLGLTDAASTLSDAYLLIDTSTTAGTGIVGQTLQFHGTADLYTLNGATALAALYSDAATATSYPAITVNTVGTSGGLAAAFTFDLARSIVYTHQGNPAWQTGHVNPLQSYGTALDLFYPNWVDFSKITIPQADEQQRFLANLLIQLNADEKPLPRFWYFPSGKKAAIILTGDDHIGRGSPSGSSAIFFDRHISQSPEGCSVEDWECVRSSSYGYVGNTISDAAFAAYTAQGFEFGLHADAGLASGGGWCGTWPADMAARYIGQYDALFDKYASLPVQSSERSHCYSWFGYGGPAAGGLAYAATPEIEADLGIRLDTNISYNPGSWATVNPGYQMGSGMLMRMAQVDAGGTMRSYLDIYNGGTQMNDDNGQGAAAMRGIVDSYLDAAIGPKGYYGAFVVNMHSDNWYGWSYLGSDQIVASAQARNIPVVSGTQMVEWLDGRNGSFFSNITLTGSTLSFDINPAEGARNLQAMLPVHFGSNPLSILSQDGSPITFTLETIKGVEYAIFDAAAGSYSAAYTPDSYPPAITQLAADPALSGNAEITWTTNEPSTSQVNYGIDPHDLSLSAATPGLTTQHTVQLTDLHANTTYYYRVTSGDEAGNMAEYPAAGTDPASFSTPSATFIDTLVDDFRAGAPDANIVISQLDNGEVMLKAAVYEEFNGQTLPAGWQGCISMSTTTCVVTVANGQLIVNGANAGTTALFGPGHIVEATARFTSSPYQHVGFGVNHTAATGDAWAIISTGSSGTQLYARSFTGSGAFDTANTPISGNYFDAPHRYRVDWQADKIVFSIDGTVVATHAVAISTQMRPLVSEGGAGGAALSVDQLQMGPFLASGQFTSRVLDALGPVTDSTIAWDAVVPESTGLEMSVRTGNTAVPDASWSAFIPVQSGDPIGSGFRYVQYQANFISAGAALTPLLQEVRIPYNASTDTTAPQVTGRFPAPGAENVLSTTDITATFSEPVQNISADTFRLRAAGATEDIPAEVTYSGVTANLHPLAPLDPDLVYQVTIAGIITDLVGNILGSDDTWTFSLIQPAGPAWMNPDWAYRRSVTVLNLCADVQTEYPVKITLDSSFDFVNAKSDGSDLRVTEQDGLTLVPFWIERWDSNGAVIWARPAILPVDETSLFLYYGNAEAAAAGSASAVFSFSEDFSGSALDTTRWTVTNGTAQQATFSNGVMTLTATSAFIKINSVPTFGPGYMIESLIRHPQAGTGNMIAEVGQATDFGNMLRIVDDFPDIQHWQWIANSPVVSVGVTSMTQTTLNQDWNNYRVGRAGGQASFQVNDWAPSTTTSGLPTINLSAFLMSYGAGNQVQVDWLQVRKWCGSEPTISIDSREQRPTQAGIRIEKTGPETILYAPEQLVPYSLTISNNGDMALSDVTVTDSLAPACDLAIGDLAPGVEHTYTCTRLFANQLTISNTAVVSGTASDGSAASAEDTWVTRAVQPGVGLSVQPETQSVLSGGSASFQVTVVNTGDISLAQLTVDSDDTGNACSRSFPGGLAVGASSSYTCVLPNITQDITLALHASAAAAEVAGTFTSDDSASVSVTAADTGAPWLSGGWRYRSPVIVSNPCAEPVDGGYQVQLTLGSAFDFSKAQAEAADLRVTASDGVTLIPFWIEQWDPAAQQASLWMKVPQIPLAGTVIYIYYGSSSPAMPDLSLQEVPPTGPFTRQGNIVPIGDTGGGASLLAENIVYDPITGHYWLVFANYRNNSVGLVWSDDPANPNAWNWHTANPIATQANAPHLQYYDGLWYLFYSDWSTSSPISISVSTATSVGGPYTKVGAVLSPSEDWEAWRVDEPYVFQRNDGKWVILYMADSGGYHEQVSFATADNILGPYTKFGADPALAWGPSGTFDAGTIADPWVVEFEGTYYIGYTVSPTINSPWQTALATTTDWQTFTKHGVILPLGSGNDAANSFRGAVTRVGDTYVFSYTNDGYRMAIATMPAIGMPVNPINNRDAVFGFYDSFDGTQVDTTKWVFQPSTAANSTAVSGGILTLTSSSGTVEMAGNKAFGAGTLLESLARHPDADGTVTTAAEVGLGTIGRGGLIRILDYNQPVFIKNNTAGSAGGNTFTPMSRPLDTENYLMHRIYWSSASETRFQIENDPWETLTDNVPGTALPPWLMVYANPKTTRLQVDWIRARSYCGADAALVVLGEQVGNQPPTATDQDLITEEDTPLNIILEGSDPDGDALTYTVTSQPQYGSLSGDAPALSYMPQENWNGSDSFTFTVSDGIETFSGTVNINVTPLNDPPLLDTIGNKTVEEETLLTFTAAGTDVDLPANVLTFSLEDAPQGAEITAEGAFTWTPTEAQGPGSYTLIVSVCDNAVPPACDEETITITVSMVNDAPTAQADAYTSAEDTPLNIIVPGVLANDSDKDGDGITAVLVSGTGHGNLHLDPTGSFTYTPAGNWFGTDSFTYVASDSSLDSGSATVTITVTPVNDAPAAAGNSYTTAEDTLLNIEAPGVLGNDSDVDGDTLFAELVSEPVYGTLDLMPDGSFQYSPAADYNGAVEFTYRALDGTLQSDVVSVSISITPVNDTPVATDDSYTTDEDTALTIAVAGVLSNDSDIDGDPLTAVLADGPTNGTLALNADGAFTYTPDLNWNGTDSFTYIARDSVASSNNATVTITVLPVNDAPVAVDDSYLTEEDTLLTTALPGVLGNDTDVEGNPLNAVLVSGPAHGTLTLVGDGSFTFIPTADWNGTDEFSYQVNDGAAASNVAKVTLTVVPVNDAPLLEPIGSKTVDELVLLTFTATASDIDSSSLTFSLSGAPAGASIDSTTGVFTWTPTEAQGYQVYPCTVRVTDDGNPALYDEEEITITVNEVNLEPVLGAINDQTVKWGRLLAFTATATDPDVPANTLTFSLLDAPLGAGIDGMTGAFSWTPSKDQVGLHTFIVRVTDNGSPLRYDEEEITVEVTRRSTKLAYTGNTNGQYSDGVLVQATLLDEFDEPVEGRVLEFTIGTQNATANTASSGIAQNMLILNQGAALTNVTTEFRGDTQYETISNTDPFTIAVENARVTFSSDNRIAVQVTSPGGTSGLFSLLVFINEVPLAQDTGTEPHPGSIANAQVSMTLAPVGPGSPVTGTCSAAAVSGTGYEALLPVTCSFSNVAVNTYTVLAAVGGLYYSGSAEDVMVVFDPSLGFTTGGGWFYWPGTENPLAGYAGDRTNFGFTMKYTKKGTNMQGSLLMIRHLADGTIYRVKSNALNGLALGETPTIPMGFASFSGKSTYQEPGWLEPNGNYEFTAYVEDRNEPGTGVDRFWIQVAGGISMEDPASTNARSISGGNIFVPHKAK